MLEMLSVSVSVSLSPSLSLSLSLPLSVSLFLYPAQDFCRQDEVAAAKAAAVEQYAPSLNDAVQQIGLGVGGCCARLWRNLL